MHRRVPVVEEQADVTTDRLGAMMEGGRRSKGNEIERKAQETSRHNRRADRALKETPPVFQWGSGDQQPQHGEALDSHGSDEEAALGSTSVQSSPRGDAFEDDALFFVDTAGDTSAVSFTVEPTTKSKAASKGGTKDTEPAAAQELLLPEHVQLGGLSQQAREIAQEEIDTLGQDGDYLEIDGVIDGAAARYYLPDRETAIEKTKECGACGETGHLRKECPHEQCLACGALDEHRTRDCPLRISCFRCGGHGHFSRDCPEARTSYRTRECPRCGAPNHSQATCPTLWRIYVYRDEDAYRAERRKKSREMRKTLAATGGDVESGTNDSDEEPDPREDWDPAERWCYNCASHGDHWGDDCPYDRIAYRRSAWTSSIFSEARANDGPFAAALAINPAQQDPRGAYTRGHPHVYGMSVGPSSSIHVYGSAGASRGSNRGEPDRERERDRQAFERANPTRPSEAYRKQARKAQASSRSRGQDAWEADDVPPRGDDVHLNGARKRGAQTSDGGQKDIPVVVIDDDDDDDDDDEDESAPPKKRSRKNKGRSSGGGSFNLAARLSRRDSLDEQRDFHLAAARNAASGSGSGGAEASRKAPSAPTQTSRQAQSERDRASNDERRRRREQSERDRARKRNDDESKFGPFSKDTEDAFGNGDFEFDFESDFRGGAQGSGRDAKRGRSGERERERDRDRERERGWDREPGRRDTHGRDGRRADQRPPGAPFRRPVSTTTEGRGRYGDDHGGSRTSRSGNGRSGPMYKGGYR